MKRPMIKAILAVMLAALCAAPTVNVFVAADADDAYQLADGSGLSVLADNNVFCRNTLTERAGFRFTGVLIPAGATITDARLRPFIRAESNLDNIHVTIAAHDTASPVDFSTADIVSREASLTTATIDWDGDNLAGSTSQYLTSPDLAAIIQELVDSHGGYDSGSIAIILTPKSGSVMGARSYYFGEPAELEISFTGENTTPAVTITDPPGTLNARVGQRIRLAGNALDAEDGDISADIAWSSSIDGALDTGAEVYVTLTAGTHTITASVTDSGSSEDTDTVSVVVSERRAVIRNRTRIPRRKVSRGFRWF